MLPQTYCLLDHHSESKRCPIFKENSWAIQQVPAAAGLKGQVMIIGIRDTLKDIGLIDI